MREYKIIHRVNLEDIENDQYVKSHFERYEHSLKRKIQIVNENKKIRQMFVVNYADIPTILYQTTTDDGIRILNQLAFYSSIHNGHFRQVIVHDNKVILLGFFGPEISRKELASLGVLVTKSL